MTRPARPAAPRRGMAMAFVLVCMTLVTLTLTATLTRLTLARRHLRLQQQEAQVSWLAESAAELAVARLRQDPTYHGETWQIARDQLPTGQPATITIEVTAAESSGGRVIRATANYPDSSPTSVCREKRVRLRTRVEGNGP